MKTPTDNSINGQVARHQHEIDKLDELHGECCFALARDPDSAVLKAEVKALEDERAERLAHIERLRKASIVDASKNTVAAKQAALALQKERVPAYLAGTEEAIAATAAAVEYIHGIGPLLARIQAVQQERLALAAAGLRAGSGKDFIARHASRAGLANCEMTIGAALAHALASAGVGRTRPSMDPYVTVSAPGKAPDVAAGLRKAADNIVTVLSEFIARDELETNNG
ncbi:MAG: hypothetical protein H0W40_11370 [Methylibium sp.]|uniref:hypothetical protein n=1 Tax=Methylibium sp. TaxID=2067992 RepID=UPI00182D1DF1|nr:hypothetical protein [Methylibium sp.]MBA3597957.1 hypothetical protein [Methylibium sp.]